jgi:hypothetical protein
VSFSFLIPLVFAHPGLPAMKYSSVKCVLSENEQAKKTVEQNLMTLMIEEDLGKFAQIQFGDQKLKIQYQILLESDAKNAGAVNVLQNLKVDNLESSSEFSAVNPTYARLGQGIYSVRCDLIMKDATPAPTPSAPSSK